MIESIICNLNTENTFFFFARWFLCVLGKDRHVLLLRLGLTPRNTGGSARGGHRTPVAGGKAQTSEGGGDAASAFHRRNCEWIKQGEGDTDREISGKGIYYVKPFERNRAAELGCNLKN